MVRGNQYLEFESDQSVGVDNPRPAGRPRQAPQANNDAAPAGLFVLFLLSMSVIGGLMALADKRAVPAATAPPAAQQVRAPEVASQLPDHAPQVAPLQSHALEATPPQDREMQVALQREWELVEPASPPPLPVLDLQVNGRVYRIESRGRGIRGTIPPGFKRGHAVTDLRLFDMPRGRFLGIVPTDTRFLYTKFVYREPCWRWMITLDGAHKGYFCPDSAPEIPKQPAERSPSPPATFTYEYDGWTHEAPLYPTAPEEDRIPLAPPRSGCASVPGVIQTFTINNGPKRKYELPLCGDAARQFQRQ